MSDEKKEPEQTLKPTDDDFILRQGQAIFSSAQSGYDLILDRMRQDMDLYDGKFSPQERKYSEYLGAPRLFIPKTYTNTQRIAVDVMDAFFFDPEEIVGVRSFKNVPQEYIQAVKSLLNYRLNTHPIDFYKEGYEATIDAIRSLYAVFKVYPKIEVEDYVQETIISQPLENGIEIPVLLREKKKRIKNYEPRIECCNPEDVRFSRNATWKDYWAHPIIHQYTITRDEAKARGYKNVDAVMAASDTQTGNQVKDQRNEKYQSPFRNDTMVKNAQHIWVFETWDFLPYEGKLESCSYTLLGSANGPSVVGRSWKLNELPYRVSNFEKNRPPFVLGMAYPEPHRLPGKSYPQITEALQQETNAQRNQEREAVARDLRKTVYVNRDANVDLVALTNRRIGGYVTGDGAASEAITEIPSSNSAAMLMRTQSRTDNDYYEAGLPPNLLGSSSGEDTATGQTQQLANANKKIQQVLRNIGYTLFVPAFNMLLRLEQTYCSDEYVRMVTGKVLGWQFPDDNFPAKEIIQGDFDLYATTGMNKQAQVNRLLLLSDRMTQYNAGLAQLVQLGVVNPAAATFANPTPIFDDILITNGYKNLPAYKLQAQPPVPQGDGAPGIASQPRNVAETGGQVSQMSPAAPEALNA
jgi:hypothetical protein